MRKWFMIIGRFLNMNKQELIALLEELVKLDSLENRKEDLKLVKKEYRFITNREDESFYEKQLTDKVVSLYKELAKKEESLLLSNYDEKKNIIAEARKLLGRNDFNKAGKELEELSNEFRRVGKAGSKEQDDELWEEFRKVKDEFYENRRKFFEQRDALNEEKRQKKLEVIAKAKEVLKIENFKDANEKMNALRQEWKDIGFTGKSDDALWEEFKAVLDEFQEKRRAHHSEMLKTFEQRATKKEELIKTAKKLLADSDFSDEEIERLKKLRKEFWDIGFASKEKEDDLNKAFNDVIDQYYKEMKFYK